VEANGCHAASTDVESVNPTLANKKPAKAGFSFNSMLID